MNELITGTDINRAFHDGAEGRYQTKYGSTAETIAHARGRDYASLRERCEQKIDSIEYGETHKQGERAYRDGYDTSDCPYNSGVRRLIWIDGFLQERWRTRLGEVSQELKETELLASARGAAIEYGQEWLEFYSEALERPFQHLLRWLVEKAAYHWRRVEYNLTNTIKRSK